jgi:hypothetical protein
MWDEGAKEERLEGVLAFDVEAGVVRGGCCGAISVGWREFVGDNWNSCCSI